jgi:phosphate transport system permease protein
VDRVAKPPGPRGAMSGREEMAVVASQAGITLKTFRGSTSRRRKERIVHGLFAAAAALSVLISVAIILALLDKAIGFLTKVPLGQLWTTGWFPRQSQFDLPTIMLGTGSIVLVAMVVAIPVGLGAAIYLAEYSDRRLRRFLKPILETLAGVPSVVMGFFALSVISPDFVKKLFSGSAGTFSLMAAGIGVGILTIPLVASVAEDAMFAVPGALREAAYGIGARRRTVTTKVVFPAAASGIAAAVILGISRAIGETMVVAIAAGATGGSLRTWDLLGPGQTMTGAISSLAVGSDQVAAVAGQKLNPYDALYLVGFLLFVFTLTLNLVSERFVRRVRRNF